MQIINPHVDGAETLFSDIINSNLDFNSPRVWGSIMRYMIVCRYIDQLGSKNQKETIRVLDIGCSAATLFGFLKKCYKFSVVKKIDYVGVDVRQDSLDEAVSYYGNEPTLIQYDLADGELNKKFNRKFDIVIAQQVLEHLGKEIAEELISTCHLLLENNGVFILSAPNPKKELGENFVSDKNHEVHLFEFSLAEMTQALSQRGFKIIEHFGALPREQIRSLNADTPEEEQFASSMKMLSHGFFIAMFCTFFPEKSKTYMIAANKREDSIRKL